MEQILAGKLSISVYTTRDEMGTAAGKLAATVIRDTIAQKGRANVIFASAPSQNETLAALIAAGGIDWSCVTAFHMDEYIGAGASAPYSFRRYLHERLLSKLPVKHFFGLAGEAGNAEATAREYASLLNANPPDLCLAGIGENGHIAFNDPPVADFNDPLDVKVVELDDACRTQQVADGAFPRIEDVPRRALSLTVPRLFRTPVIILSVPGPRKAEAVRATVEGPIATSCPASILRTHENAHLFLDKDSAALIKG